MNGYRKWWSEDEEFGLKLTQPLVARLQELFDGCDGIETGGVLFGIYTSKNCAEVTTITTAPRDSKAGATWFQRGVYKLQDLINRMWTKKNKEFYLGEWHCHPFGLAEPSDHDVQQMETIANSKNYYCPEPILIIVGGDPMNHSDLGIFVFPKGRSFLRLLSKD